MREMAAETKELIAGIAMVNLDSMTDAVSRAKKFLALVGEGESEIRLMHDGRRSSEGVTHGDSS
jgi:hypothetical protein